uniref:Retrovirus-related Pol polyprotein from transposon TNT 1-94-like beta-barrel domain-containing protein n=1 Tax=Cajanus cajan TaxID=3821 RepID=A0A151R2H8_CAJCA|nr:hypothetical protein KK1_042152 [Cajanus cajan]
MEKYCRNKNKHQANFAEEKDGEQHLFYASQDSNSETSGSWYLDSGCSNHMAKDASIFKDIDESVKVKVRMGNDTVVESKGKGTIMVETKKGTRLITDVLLVPNLKENLLSIDQMMEKGYTLHFEGDTCKIYDSKNGKNLVHHSRTKHIAIKYHFIREAETTKEIKMEYCKTEEQVADI